MNPNGLVPTIKDGDFVLWESNSIMRYLNAKYGNGKLLPASAEGMANANRWMDWQLSAFNPAIVPLFLPRSEPRRKSAIPKLFKRRLRKPSRPGKRSTNQLAKNRFLGGDEFSLGDIPLGVWAYRWFNLPIERPKHANLERWYDSLKQHEPYQYPYYDPGNVTRDLERSTGWLDRTSLSPGTAYRYAGSAVNRVPAPVASVGRIALIPRRKSPRWRRSVGSICCLLGFLRPSANSNRIFPVHSLKLSLVAAREMSHRF